MGREYGIGPEHIEIGPVTPPSPARIQAERILKTGELKHETEEFFFDEGPTGRSALLVRDDAVAREVMAILRKHHAPAPMFRTRHKPPASAESDAQIQRHNDYVIAPTTAFENARRALRKDTGRG